MHPSSCVHILPPRKSGPSRLYMYSTPCSRRQCCKVTMLQAKTMQAVCAEIILPSHLHRLLRYRPYRVAKSATASTLSSTFLLHAPAITFHQLKTDLLAEHIRTSITAATIRRYPSNNSSQLGSAHPRWLTQALMCRTGWQVLHYSPCPPPFTIK